MGRTAPPTVWLWGPWPLAPRVFWALLPFCKNQRNRDKSVRSDVCVAIACVCVFERAWKSVDCGRSRPLWFARQLHASINIGGGKNCERCGNGKAGVPKAFICTTVPKSRSTFYLAK